MIGSSESISIENVESSGRKSFRRLLLFNERYGEGSHTRLLGLLARPCVSFADIAARFNVTRERVRQWHREWLPSAPTGRERRQRCRALRAQRALLEDPLVGAFHALVRARPDTRLGFISCKTGYRRRIIRVNGHVVALRRARSSAGPGPGTPGVRVERYQGPADLLYVSFGDAGYVLVPVTSIPKHGLVIRDWTHSRVAPYVNTLRALDSEATAPETVR